MEGKRCLLEHTLVFQVYDWDRFGLNEAMASCAIPLAEVDFRAPVRNEWRTLDAFPEEDKVVFPLPPPSPQHNAPLIGSHLAIDSCDLAPGIFLAHIDSMI